MRNKIRYCIHRKTFESILRKPENRIYKNNKTDISIFQKYNKYNYYIRKRKRYSYEVKNIFDLRFIKICIKLYINKSFSFSIACTYDF